VAGHLTSAEESCTQVEACFLAALDAEDLLGLADELATAALREAIACGEKDQVHELAGDGQVPLLLAISDNGPQMRSHSTREFLAGVAIAQQFGRPHTPQDQTWIETLFGHVKGEWPHLENTDQQDHRRVRAARPCRTRRHRRRGRRRPPSPRHNARHARSPGSDRPGPPAGQPVNGTPRSRAEAITAARKADTSRRRQRVLQALAASVSAGDDITPGGIARRAGVHRSFLYRHPDLLAEIHTAQSQPPAVRGARHDAPTRESLQADLAAAHERASRQAAHIRQLERKLSALLGQQAWHESGLGAPADIDALNQKIAHLEQHVTDLRLQLERNDEDLHAARAANRELMTQLNLSVPAQHH